jgi:hypothetical protein
MDSLAVIIKPVFRKTSLRIKIFIAIALMMVLPSKILLAQQILSVDTSTDEHLFDQKEIKLLEDKKGTLSLQQVISPEYEKKFQENPTRYPQNYNLHSWYW